MFAFILNLFPLKIDPAMKSDRLFFRICLFLVLSFCIRCTGRPAAGSAESDGTVSPADSVRYPVRLEKDKSGPVKKIALQDAADVQYIRLETTDASLLPKKNWFRSIYFTGDNIFLSFGGQVFRFSSEGKFRNTIGRQGGGPQDFVRMCAFGLAEGTREIFLLDFFQRRVIVFDYEGKVKRQFRTERDYDHFYVLNDSCALFCSNEPSADDRIVLGSLKNGTIVRSLLPARLISDRRLMVNIGAYPRIVPYRNFVNLCTATSDTVYAYNTVSGKLEPRFYQYPLNEQVEKDAVKTVPYMQFETERYAGILINDTPFPAFIYLVDKRTGRAEKAIFTDRNKGSAVWCWGTNLDNTTVDLLDVQELQDLLAAGKLQGALKDAAVALAEDDNPVLLVARFR